MATKGSWMGVYGGDGFQTLDDATNDPAYVTMTPAGVVDYTWDGGSTDIRALERAAGAGRLAATWYGPTFSIDLNFTDGATHAVAFYIVDWDSFNRTERFDIRDAVRGTILDSRTATRICERSVLAMDVPGPRDSAGHANRRWWRSGRQRRVF